ncbi:MAG TPA: PLP-dependent aspartate aminotransferase family protein, partial [Thermomicrobiales bacterium]|nr:PLP-dependent aspartate aminotransferase family protein [Thermomicrobiales bacterium]
ARGFASRAVHAGERPPRPDFTPTVTPIYPAASFSYDEAAIVDAVFGNEREGYVYTRYGNPTTHALEEAVASLEGTDAAVAYASGMAAVHAAILNEVQAESRIVASQDLYGATTALLRNVFATLGVKTTFVDILDLEQVRTAIDETKPRLVVLETISNPLLRVADVPAIVNLAHGRRARVLVDNTFASPVLVNPARFGADIVLHSSTKYLGGHGDATGGVVATTRERAAELAELNKLTGGILGPFESWLTLRGIKTLPLRVRRQSDNAAIVARWLAAQPGIVRVNYPGLADLGPAAAMFNDEARGGMLSFEIAGAERHDAFDFMQALRLCVPATTLGDVYSLVLQPAMSSHRAL